MAFRGSDEIQDWTKYDLKINRYEIKNGIYVHEGFYRFIQCDGFQSEIEKQIRDLKPERVIVTGHSLGAGAAVLSSYFLAQAVPEVKFETIIFGGPEIGDKQVTDMNMNHKNQISLPSYVLSFSLTLSE